MHKQKRSKLGETFEEIDKETKKSIIEKEMKCAPGFEISQ